MPAYLITAPDGRKFRVSGEGSKEDALAHIQATFKPQAAQPEAPADPSAGGGELRPFGIDTGIKTPEWLDRGLAGAGKAVSDTYRGMKQLDARVSLGSMYPQQAAQQENAQVAQQDAPLMGSTAGKVGNFAGNAAMAAPTAFVPGANTVTGSALVGAGLGMIQPADNDSQRLANTGLGLGAGALGQYAGGKLAGWAGNKLASRQAAAGLAQSQNVTRDATIKEGLDAGFVVPPATTNPSLGTQIAESISGKAATQGAASQTNQAVTNRLIRADLGIAEDAPLTRDALKAVRTQAGKAYEAVKQTGEVISDQKFLDDVVDLVGGNSTVSKSFPGAKVSADQSVIDLADTLMQEKFSAKAAVEYSKRLRSQAKANFKAAYAGGPEKLELAHAQWDAAGALEDAIDRHLQSQGLGDLSKKWNQSRTLIAKSYSAEAALNEGTGNIVASKLKQQLSKGKPLSGGFEQVAKFASAAPKAMAEPTQSHGVSALNAMLAAGGVGLGQPGILALPVARLLTRRAILSKGLQKRMAVPNYTPGRTGTASLQAGRGLGIAAAPLSIAYAAQE